MPPLFNFAHFSLVAAEFLSTSSLSFPQMGLDVTAFLCGVLEARCVLSVCTEAFHAAWFAAKPPRVSTLAQKNGSVIVRLSLVRFEFQELKKFKRETYQ
jgi:hypothetical protein